MKKIIQTQASTKLILLAKQIKIQFDGDYLLRVFFITKKLREGKENKLYFNLDKQITILTQDMTSHK